MYAKAIIEALLVTAIFGVFMMLLRQYRTRGRARRIQRIAERIQ